MFGPAYNIGSHFVKRGIEDNKDVGGIRLVIFPIMILLGSVLLVLAQYTFKLLLTLTVVEEPPSLYLPLNEDEQPHLVSNDNERVFITSSIRGTLRHLRREGGFWSPWRGLGPNIIFAMANGFIRGILIAILSVVLPMRLATVLGGIASMVALSRFALVCTHIMISAPSSESWWTRLQKTSWVQAKKTIPAVVIWAVSLQIVAELSILGAEKDHSTGVRISIFGTDLLAYVLIDIPALILLVRVQASVLSDDVATIVPFDKTFGQDTSDTDGVLTVQKAVNSIDRTVFKRVCIYLLKSFPLLFVMAVTFITIFYITLVAWFPN